MSHTSHRTLTLTVLASLVVVAAALLSVGLAAKHSTAAPAGTSPRAIVPMVATDRSTPNPSPSPTATATRTATTTPTATQTATQTSTAATTPTQSPTATPTPTPTPTMGACGGATATITGLNKVTEVVTVSGSGNMTGWHLISERGNQRYDFPSGYILSGSVQVVSGPNAAAGAGKLFWTTANVWNNTEDDDALLYNCLGQLVSTFEDGD